MKEWVKQESWRYLGNKTISMCILITEVKDLRGGW
jgi:hypothetical protein